MDIPLDAKATQGLTASKYSPGKIALPEAAATGGIRLAGFGYDATQHTDPAVTVTVKVEASLDGKEWRELGGFTRQGGPVPTGPSGVPDTTIGIKFSFPEKTNPMIRAEMTVNGKALDTSGALWWK